MKYHTGLKKNINKALGKNKGLDTIMNFTLRLFLRADFSSVTEDFYSNVDQACIARIFKWQGKGVSKNNDRCISYLPDEACTA